MVGGRRTVEEKASAGGEEESQIRVLRWTKVELTRRMTSSAPGARDDGGGATEGSPERRIASRARWPKLGATGFL